MAPDDYCTIFVPCHFALFYVCSLLRHTPLGIYAHAHSSKTLLIEDALQYTDHNAFIFRCIGRYGLYCLLACLLCPRAQFI